MEMEQAVGTIIQFVLIATIVKFAMDNIKGVWSTPGWSWAATTDAAGAAGAAGCQLAMCGGAEVCATVTACTAP